MSLENTSTSNVSSMTCTASSDRKGLAIAPLSFAATIFPSAVYSPGTLATLNPNFSNCSTSLSKTCGETTIPFELATDKDPIRWLPDTEDLTTSTFNVSLIISAFSSKRL